MQTRVYRGKEQIFCEWRHRWVRLTPEEWVRQQLLHRMVDELGYPAARIAVEVPFTLDADAQSDSSLPFMEGTGVGSKKHFRFDAAVYGDRLQPIVLIECKAETVPLTQKTLDQALTYNRRLGVPYLMLHNGPQTVFVNMLTPVSDSQSAISNSIPAWNSLSH